MFIIGSRIIVDTTDEGTEDVEPLEGTGIERADIEGVKKTTRTRQKSNAFTQRMLAMRNAVYDVELNNRTRRLEHDRIKQLRKIQHEVCLSLKLS